MEFFINRLQELSDLKEEIYHGSAIIMISHRRVGKTSMTLKALTEFCDDDLEICHASKYFLPISFYHS